MSINFSAGLNETRNDSLSMIKKVVCDTEKSCQPLFKEINEIISDTFIKIHEFENLFSDNTLDKMMNEEFYILKDIIKNILNDVFKLFQIEVVKFLTEFSKLLLEFKKRINSLEDDESIFLDDKIIKIKEIIKNLNQNFKTFSEKNNEFIAKIYRIDLNVILKRVLYNSFDKSKSFEIASKFLFENRKLACSVTDITVEFLSNVNTATKNILN